MYIGVYQRVTPPPTVILHSATLESIHPVILLCFVLMQHDHIRDLKCF